MSIKKNLSNLISFVLVIIFFIFCLTYYNSQLFIKDINKKRENYLVYLNSYILKLEKITTSGDFKKKVDNKDFFENIYKQKSYWELIK
jgi:predicted membrane protein